jgi:ATP-dependent exoDNAse (exonuclease V) beta subunit
MGRALAAEGRHALRRRVESAWMELGGPATVRDARALEDAQAFLDKLDGLENEQSLPAGSAFDALFVDLFAGPDPQATAQLQVMTVHRAKGLEFDAVILVGLGRARLERDPALLHWMEVAQPEDPQGLLIAPIKRTGSQPDALSGYVAARLKESEAYERARLLYVAATRAREELHLFGHVTFRLDRKEAELKLNNPERGSALSLLWPKLKPVFVSAFAGRDADTPRAMQPSPIDMPLRRIALSWTAPQPDVPVAMPAAPRMDDTPVRPEFDWATETIRHVGTVVHLELERWSELAQLPASADIEKSRARLARLLRANGVPRGMVPEALERVVRALRSTLADPRGRWIFDASHREARSELALSSQHQGEFISVKIDRTFVDAGGVRWVVDFKTSTHLGTGLEEFLDSEVLRYRPQLDRYAELVSAAGPQPVRRGLYFPLLGSWREW